MPKIVLEVSGRNSYCRERRSQRGAGYVMSASPKSSKVSTLVVVVMRIAPTVQSSGSQRGKLHLPVPAW